MKKGQVSVVSVVLLIILLVLVTIALLVLIFRPQSIGLSTNQGINPSTVNVQDEGTTSNQNTNQNTYQNPTTNQNNNPVIVCASPYIRFGSSCCLDQNNNNVCDNDENINYNQQNNKYNICEAPYIRNGNSCCLDRDRDYRCDINEDHYSSYYDDYNSDYYDNGYNRISSSDIDSPFRIRSVVVYKDELRFRLVNDGNDDLTVTRIDVEECDTRDYSFTLKSDEERTITLDCDFGYGRFDDNIDIDYKIGNSTDTASGNIRGTIDRNSDYNY